MPAHTQCELTHEKERGRSMFASMSPSSRSLAACATTGEPAPQPPDEPLPRNARRMSERPAASGNRRQSDMRLRAKKSSKILSAL